MSSILAVDDSPSMRRLVKHVLSSNGFEVVMAEDGVDALDQAKKNTVDLVLTDVNMPNMDGLQLIRELRGLPSYRYVPMLVLTTESDVKKKMEGKQAGATGWIVKPFDPTQLIKTINHVLA